jgi:hypothetical protein
MDKDTRNVVASRLAEDASISGNKWVVAFKRI